MKTAKIIFSAAKIFFFWTKLRDSSQDAEADFSPASSNPGNRIYSGKGQKLAKSFSVNIDVDSKMNVGLEWKKVFSKFASSVGRTESKVERHFYGPM